MSFAPPNEKDLVRIIEGMCARLTLEADARAGDIVRELEKDRLIEGILPVRSADPYDEIVNRILFFFDPAQGHVVLRDIFGAISPIHEQGVQEALRIAADFHQSHHHRLDQITGTIRPVLEAFTEKMLFRLPRMTPKTDNMDHTARQCVRRDFETDLARVQDGFRKRVSDALLDVQAGYVGGRNVRTSRLGLRERAFQLLQGVYEKVVEDIRQGVDVDDVGRSAGMSERDIAGAVAYLIKTGLIEHAHLGAEAPVEITPQGIAEVEDAMREPGRATPHFPAGVKITVMSRDIYNIHGQAGAVGPGTHAHDNTFQQIQAGADLAMLAEELGRLRAAMKRAAEGPPEQDEAIGAVAAAEKAARQGDGPAALRYLKVAGTWALGISEKIGVAIATEALKRALQA